MIGKFPEADSCNPPSATFTSSPQASHRLYRVLGDGADAIWTPIGAAWPNKDGLGFNIICDAVPLHGRVVLRAVQESAEEAGGQ